MIGQNCGQTRIDWKIRELCTFCACSTDDKPQQERKVAGVKYNLYCSSWGELVSVALKIALRNQRSDVRLVSGAFEEWIAELTFPSARRIAIMRRQHESRRVFFVAVIHSVGLQKKVTSQVKQISNDRRLALRVNRMNR